MAVPVRFREVSRLEAFSDAVFGFALTLLVVSLETPQSSEDLNQLVRGFLPFAVSFAMVSWIWYQHNIFFRRYGLQDAWTTALNCTLLFVVLFYVFPLKYLTVTLVGTLTNMAGRPPIDEMRGPFVMAVYSTGVMVIFALFLMLHHTAWRKRLELELTAVEQIQLKFATRAHLLSFSLAVASLIMLAVMPQQSAFAGLIYALMGPLHGWNGYMGGRAVEKLNAPAPLDTPEKNKKDTPRA